MSDLDISIFTRLTPSAIAANSELQANVAPILQAADSDGRPNAEDSVFSDAEAAAYIQMLQQSNQRAMSLFERHRAHLAGSLSSAQDRLRSTTGSEGLLSLLTIAAAQDAQDPMLGETESRRLAGELSEAELQLVATELERMETQGRELTVVGLMREVEPMISAVQELETHLPEAFMPQDAAARRNAINLNFLRLNPNLLSGTGETSQLAQGLVRIAGITPESTGDWNLDFSHVETYLRESEEPGADPERVMADLRFIAYTMREQVSYELVGSRDASPDVAGLSIALQPLIDRQASLNDPSVDQVLELAGDAFLTSPEAERILQLEEERHPGFLHTLLEGAPPAAEGETELQRATRFYMGEVRRMVEQYSSAAVVLTPEVSPEESDPDLVRSRNVLSDLERMRAGFTQRDREYAEGNALVGLIDMISYVCTIGGALTWIGAGSPTQLTPDEALVYGADAPRFGPTYRHMVRESVAAHDAERGRALEALRQIIEHPPADFSGARTIPNALDYLRNHDDSIGLTSGRGLHATAIPGSVAPGTGEHRRHYDLLVGDFFQARQLWNIHNQRDEDRQMQMWYDFAQNLRNGSAGGFWAEGTHSDGANNIQFARAILYAIRREDSSETRRDRAELAFRDSLGMDILDSRGNVLTQGGGEFGLNPYLWFRNYSDESASAVASDVVALGASVYIGGGVTSAGRSLLTSAGRQGLRASAQTFIGIRATQVAVTEAAVGTAIEGSASSGIFGRVMSRLGGPAWSSRLVASREAALRAAQASGSSAEITRAAAAFARAQRLQAILSAPTVGAGVGASAPQLTGWAARVANAAPPVPGFITRAAAGTGVRAVAARGSAAVLNNIRLASIGRAANWTMDRGIFIYGISSAVYDQTRTRRPDRDLVNYDRLYSVRREGPGAPSAPVSDPVANPATEPNADPAPAADAGSSDASAGDGGDVMIFE